jgi:hypothetical protein
MAIILQHTAQPHFKTMLNEKNEYCISVYSLLGHTGMIITIMGLHMATTGRLLHLMRRTPIKLKVVHRYKQNRLLTA